MASIEPEQNRRPRVLRNLSVCALLAWVGSCGSTRNGPDGVVPTEIRPPDASVGVRVDAGFGQGLPFDRACRQLIDARCAFLARCGLLNEDSASLELCQQQLTHQWCGASTWPARVQAGTLKYDPVLAAACNADFATAACGPLEFEPPSCQQFLKPAALPLQLCFGGPYQECVEGICRGASCPQQCQSPGVLGDSCASNADCASGLSCEKLQPGGTIGQCRPIATVNQDCSRASCAEGLYCVGGTCLPLPAAGEACLSGQCGAGAFCDTSMPKATCRPKRLKDDPCSSVFECATPLLCAEGRCEPAVRQLGERCPAPLSCAAGLRCLSLPNQPAPVCTQPGALSTPCTEDAQCEETLQCAPSMTCERKRRPGAGCSASVQCESFARCLGGQCRLLLLEGATCTQNEACASGFCLLHLKEGRCFEPAPAGAGCTRDAECQTKQCDNGTCASVCAP
jgi:Dickkopf N-terminal cysteine-rich region